MSFFLPKAYVDSSDDSDDSECSHRGSDALADEGKKKFYQTAKLEEDDCGGDGWGEIRGKINVLLN